MFEKLRQRIAFSIAPDSAPPAASARRPAPQLRMYHAAKNSRLTSSWQRPTSSADTELASSLRALRDGSRALVRDAPYAKRAKVIVQNNVIGSGIGVQAQVMSARDALREPLNDAIEEAWRDWSCAEYCHTGGTMHFSDLERMLMGQVFEAGEVFVRLHLTPFGGSEIPLALEVIESERIADEFLSPAPPVILGPGVVLKMGIEVDRFGRPLAYWIRQRHPSEFRIGQGETDKLERVPAAQILHLRLVDRWPQTRGEPWLHAVARKLNDMDGYTEAEIVAARGASLYLGSIESPEGESGLADKKDDGSKELTLEPGMLAELAAGQTLSMHTPSRPNTALDPFMRYMLREVAAGTGVSYESISRDYSQSNYSSSRLGLLDDRDLWKMLQQWFIRSFRYPLHKLWLQQAVLARAIAGLGVEQYALAPKKFEAVLFKPRGWSWIDPTKEVAAYKEAVMAGFMTVGDVIVATGGGQDLEDVLRQRERELNMMDELDLVFDTSPEVYTKAAAGPGRPAQSANPPSDGANAGDNAGADGADSANTDPPKRVVSIRR